MFIELLSATSHIEIRGNKRIEKEAIKSYISDKIFTDQEALNETLKDLYDTGYFKDVKLNLQNNKLIIDVIEQPIINKIAFEGNKRMKSSDLKKELDIQTNQAFSEFKIVEEAAQKIEAIYRAIGYFNTKVVVQIRPLSEGRVDVVFKISEGRKAFIRSIKFIGNKAFRTETLKNQIESHVYSGFRFWAQNHFFSQERLQQDYFKLQEYYHNNGYPDAAVTSLSSELKTDQTGFDLVFSVKEGNYYTFGDITIDYQHPQKINLTHLKRLLPIKTNHTFNGSLIQSAEEVLISELGRQDISTADVEILQKKNDFKIDIKITIKKGAKNKIRFINVRGNKRTYGKVVRDNLEIFEGDFLNRHRLKQSEYNLQSLGFFSKVQMNPQEISSNLYDIDINVEESTNTGSASLQGGWGSYEGFLAQIGFSESNIGGSGKAVQGNIMVASKSLELSLALSNPRLFDIPDLTGGISAEWNRSKLLHDRIQNAIGTSVSFGYPLNRYFYQRWEYSFGVDSINLKDSKDDKIDSIVNLAHRRIFPDMKKIHPLKEIKGRSIIDTDVHPQLKKDPFKFIDNLYTKDELEAQAKKINDNPEDKKKFNKLLDGMRKEPLTIDTQNDEDTKDKRYINRTKFDSDLTSKEILCLLKHKVREDSKFELLEEDFGNKIYSTLSHSLIFSPVSYNPNRKFSFRIRMDNHFAGLGGDVKYFRNDFNIKHILYLPFHSTLTTSGTIGLISKIGNTPLRLYDCKLLSGRQVHGFAEEGIGPRDKLTTENLRGTRYYWGGTEVKIPIGKPSEVGINIGGYFNFGSAHNSKFGTYDQFGTHDRFLDDNFIRTSIGCFIGLRIPMLPLRFDWAIPLRKTHYDIEERFLVGIDI